MRSPVGKMNAFTLATLIVSASFAAACSNGDNNAGVEPADASTESSADVALDAPIEDATSNEGLIGSVQKGPFVLGSTVSVSEIDKDAQPTGRVFNTTTTSNLGEFRLKSVPKGPLSISASGFYFNEAIGGVSGAQLTLRAYLPAALAAEHAAVVNVITHLTYDRVTKLVASGTPLADAQPLAESELRTALALPGAVVSSPAARLSLLGGDTDENAYLFAVSAMFMQAALDDAGATGSVDGTVQVLLNKTATDLADDGKLDPTTVAPLRMALRTMFADDVRHRMQVYLKSSGTTVVVPDLNRFIDSDDDGVVNSSDNCALVANPTQVPVIGSVCAARAISTLYGVKDAPAARKLAVADFNEDGHLDVVAFVEGVAPMLLGDGLGGFTVGDSGVKLAGFAEQWAAADVNGDGPFDLVVAARDWSSSRKPGGYYPGDGTGKFGAFVEPFSSESVYQYAVADYDGDKVPDLAAFVPSTKQILLARGNGAGAFKAPTSLPFPSGSNRIDAVDVDGNKTIDIVVTGTNGVTTLLNDGKGTFTASSTSYATDFFQPPQIGDLDGDGHLDLTAWRMSSSYVWSPVALYGDGSGGFGRVASIAGSDLTAPFLSKTRVDLFYYASTSTGSSTSDIFFLRGSAPPFATPQVIRQPEHRESGMQGFSTADLDGDGTPDLVFTDADPRTNRPTVWSVLLRH